jgi:DNA mismatch repair protein MutS
MTFRSILFEHSEDASAGERVDAPDCFVDLNLHQVIDAVTAGMEEYDLKPFFYRSLHSVDAVKYRQEIMQDLENATLFRHVSSFAEQQRLMRAHLAQADKLYYKQQKQAWFLDAVEVYCDAVKRFATDLSSVALKSRGLSALREYLTAYVNAPHFASLLTETRKLKAGLATVKYCVLINGSTVTVRKYESEPDYSVEVETTFERFKQAAGKDYRVDFPNWPDMDHVEAQILDFVAKLYPDIFSDLENYCDRNKNYLDETLAIFDREVQFYIGYLNHIAALKHAGLKFCYPQISAESKDIYGRDGFDLALAQKLVAEKAPVVCNDFSLKGRERVLAISGPNQGGKTTFARTFGQLHYLACIGCPVPAREARLFLFDGLFTHFEREENISNLHGKLQDDLIRLRDILDQATSKSILIMNEIFTSTTLNDAIFLSEKMMEKIIRLDLLCFWVTFIDEVGLFSEQVVSMVSGADPANPTLRTFKFTRKPPDGLAYAMAIAEKYRLTYDRLKERLAS